MDRNKHHSRRDLFFEALEDRRVLSGLTENWLIASSYLKALPATASPTTAVLVSSGVASAPLSAATQVVAPTIAINSYTGQRIANGGTFNFGTAIQGQAAPTFVFYVSNNGNATLNLGTPSIPTGFQLIEGLPSSLAPGTTDSFTLALSTTNAGTFSGNLSIASNDTTANPYLITLTGIVNASAGPAISLTTVNGLTLPTGASVDFGTVVRGQTSPQLTFLVHNNGTAALTLGTLTLPTGFRLLEGLPPSLAVGGVDSFTVAMDTSSIGTKSGVLQLVNGDVKASPFVLSLRGVVSATAAAGVAVTNASGLVLATGSLVDVGSVALGATATPTVFVVQNQGTATLSLGTLAVPNGYQIVDPLASSLAPGKSDTFSVALTSNVVGLKTGKLSFTTNDLSVPLFQLSLTGQVVTLVPEISVTTLTGQDIPMSGTVDFGTVMKGTTAQQTIVITNVGTSALTLGNVTVPFGFQLVSSVPAIVAPQASVKLVVQMTTSTMGAKTGELRIVNNDPNENPYRLVLSGQVTTSAAQLTVTNGAEQALASGSIIEFGKVYVGQAYLTQTITIANTGTKTMNISTLTVPTGYRVVSQPMLTIAAGTSQTVTIQLLTTTAGVKTGALSFTTNDTSNPTFTLALTGQVLANAAQIQVLTSSMTNVIATSVIDFGSAAKGSSGPIQTFVIKNLGTRTLTLGTVSLPSGFKLVSAMPRSILAGGSATFSVQLLTTSVGSKLGTLSVVTNDPTANPFTFTIKGKVT